MSRALAVLTLVADSGGAVGVTEVARQLGIPPSSAHRLLSALVSTGFARRTAANRYRRGHALLRLVGRPLAMPMRLRELARPILGRLADRTDETAHLAVLDGVDVVALDHVEGRGPLVARHPVGSRLPCHGTAVGLAILAHVPEAVDALLEAGLPPLTSATITDQRQLEEALQAVRQRGYAVNVGGWHAETAGVAAPIIGSGGECLASVGISGPTARVGSPLALAELGRMVSGASHDITELLRIDRPEAGHAAIPHIVDGAVSQPRHEAGGSGRSA